MIECKKCKWYDIQDTTSYGYCCFYPHIETKNETDFCSKAEPKDSEQED